MSPQYRSWRQFCQSDLACHTKYQPRQTRKHVSSLHCNLRATFHGEDDTSSRPSRWLLRLSMVGYRPWSCHQYATFIDFYKRRIIQTKQKVVSWHSRLVASLSATQRDQNICTSPSHNAATLDKPPKDDKATSHPIRIPRKTVLKLHSKLCVSVSTTASSTSTIGPRISERPCQLTFAAHGVINVLLSQPFCILFTSFSATAMRLPKHMLVA